MKEEAFNARVQLVTTQTPSQRPSPSLFPLILGRDIGYNYTSPILTETKKREGMMICLVLFLR